MDAVLGAAVKRAVRLIVGDVRAGVLQNLFARLGSLEGCVLFGRVWRDALDLLGVEDRVYAVDEPRFPGVRFVVRSRAPIGGAGGSGWLCLVRSLFDLPVFNLGAFLAPADLPSVIGSLLVRHPPLVVVAALQAGGHQMKRVAAAVRSFAGGVERHAERTGSGLPRLLPRSDATLQHLYDVVGHLLAEVPECWFVCVPTFDGLGSSGSHGRYSSPLSSAEENSSSGSSVSKPDPANGSPPIASSDTADRSR